MRCRRDQQANAHERALRRTICAFLESGSDRVSTEAAARTAQQPGSSYAPQLASQASLDSVSETKFSAASAVKRTDFYAQQHSGNRAASLLTRIEDRQPVGAVVPPSHLSALQTGLPLDMNLLNSPQATSCGVAKDHSFVYRSFFPARHTQLGSKHSTQLDSEATSAEQAAHRACRVQIAPACLAGWSHDAREKRLRAAAASALRRPRSMHELALDAAAGRLPEQESGHRRLPRTLDRPLAKLVPFSVHEEAWDTSPHVRNFFSNSSCEQAIYCELACVLMTALRLCGRLRYTAWCTCNSAARCHVLLACRRAASHSRIVCKRRDLVGDMGMCATFALDTVTRLSLTAAVTWSRPSVCLGIRQLQLAYC